MRAYRISSAVTALILTFGLVTVACSSSDGESQPAGGDDAGVGGTGGTGGTGATGGAAGEAGMAGTAGSAGEAGTGGTGGGTGATGGTGGTTQDAGPDVVKPDTCDGNGYTAIQGRAEKGQESSGDAIWLYNGSTGTTGPFESLHVEIWESYGAPMVPGTYTLDAAETSYDTCGVCFILSSDCDMSSQQTSCDKTYMPYAGSTYTINSLGDGVGDTFSITLDDVAFREVTIDDNWVATDVPNGSTWCVADGEATSEIVAPGFVDMEPPTGLSCQYPDGPYHFMGPEDGETTPAPGTVPPMGWPGAYFGGQEVGFDLAQYKCDHPEIKTLFLIVGAGWCPSCKDFMEQSVCPNGGLEDQLHAENAELLYVWGDGNQPGWAASNQYADTKVSSYGCDGGYRIADVDNTAGFRVIYSSSMFEAIPWAAAIRMSDMKLTHEQSETASQWMDFVGIAQTNNQ